MVLNRFRKNVKGRDFVVGDIHGNFDELRRQLGWVDFDSKRDRLFATGDLVDRGPESHKALSWLRADWFESAMGNHDLHVVNYEKDCQGTWYERGGAWHAELGAEQKKIWQRVFEKLPYAIEVESKIFGKVGIIHADCPVADWLDLEYLLQGTHNCTVQDVRNRRNCCCFSRNRFKNKDHGFNHGDVILNVDKVFFGHNIVKEKTERGNCVYIDTFQHNEIFTIVEI